MKSRTIVWNDEFNVESYLLCMNEFGIQCINARIIDDENAEITVYGEDNKIDDFIEAFESGDVEPLCTMSRGIEDDDDYEKWLSNEIWFLKHCADNF